VKRDPDRISLEKSKRDDQRSRILEVGAELLAERGIEAVNSNQIARAAGVGVGTFYAHFPDKLALRHALAAEAVERLGARVERAVAAAGGEVELQVRALVEAVVAFAEEAPARFRVAFGREAVSGAPGRAAIGLSDRAALRRLQELRRGGRIDASIDPAVAARAFTCMQNGVVCWWLEDPGRAPRDALVDTLARLHPAVAGRTSA